MTGHALAATRSTSARLTEAAPVFAALGDATRLRIVARLCDGGPQSIVRLGAGEDISRQAITKHLRALEEAGLVQSAREGRERMWALRTQRLADVRRHLDLISEQWNAAIGRLRELVEDIEESRD